MVFRTYGTYLAYIGKYCLSQERLPTFPCTNAICTVYECRLINRHFTTLKSYNPELLSIK